MTSFEQLALPAPPSSSSSNPPGEASVSPNIDLLSGDDYFKPELANSQALVPVGNPPTDSASGHNTFDLVDMFGQSNASHNNQNPVISSPILNSNPNLSAPQVYPAPQHTVPPQQPSPFSNGLTSNTMTPYDQCSDINSASSWNGQFAHGMIQPQQAPNYGDMVACSAGASFTPHIITVAPGELEDDEWLIKPSQPSEAYAANFKDDEWLIRPLQSSGINAADHDDEDWLAETPRLLGAKLPTLPRMKSGFSNQRSP